MPEIWMMLGLDMSEPAPTQLQARGQVERPFLNCAA